MRKPAIISKREAGKVSLVNKSYVSDIKQQQTITLKCFYKIQLALMMCA